MSHPDATRPEEVVAAAAPTRPPASPGRAPAAAGGAPAAILAMQRGVGNAITARMLLRDKDEDEYVASSATGVPTYDATKKAEKWTTADAPGSEPKQDDKRRFPQADARPERQKDVYRSMAEVSSVEDVDALDPDVIRDINPQSMIPYRILKDVLHESWHVAKELLLHPRAPNANRSLLMKKLWEYRQWHHQEILAEVMDVLNEKEKGALNPSKGAGSTTLSSDIDVNLKGSQTELAVPLFNERFRNSKRLPAHKWVNEPGVVYDVNVYAIDFMHKYGSNPDAEGHKVTQKEGARPGREGGGIGDEHLQSRDRHLQLVTALFKARLFMNSKQWADYEESMLRGLSEKEAEPQREAFREAELRFAGYLAEMSAKMDVKLEEVADQAASGVDQLKAGAAVNAPAKDAHDHAAHAKQENELMTAANRIYEEKLAVIRTKRAKLRKLIDDLKAAPEDERPEIESMIDGSLLALRALVAEAAMYANEASMTDATIHHGVVGIQGGLEIDQQKSEGVNAVHEHLADVMKEAGRYGSELGPGAYKAGKYLMRLGDAGRNLGFGYIWGVQVLYDLGRKISEDIKVRADSPPTGGGPVDTAAESAAAVLEITGRKTLAELLELAAETASDVVKEYTQERLAHTRAGETDTETAFGHRTAPEKAENKHVLNQDMQHPIDRNVTDPAKKAKTKADLVPEKQGEFSFRLTEAELTALKEKWSKGSGV